MKIKSISGIICTVENLDQTATFYEKVGFRAGKRDETSLTMYVNWFWLEFQQKGKPEKTSGEASIAVNIENIEEFYDDVVAKGLKPESEIRVGGNGRQEFVLRDPDGYQLTFFEKK